MHARTFPCALAWCLAALLTAGCSSYRDPAIESAHAVILERTPEALQLGFALDLSNPNDEALELLEFRYDLELDGEIVYEGRRSALATLSRGGHREVILPAVLPQAALDERDDRLPYRLRGTLTYLTPGELVETLFDLGVRRPKVGFAAEGAVMVE